MRILIAVIVVSAFVVCTEADAGRRRLFRRRSVEKSTVVQKADVAQKATPAQKTLADPVQKGVAQKAVTRERTRLFRRTCTNCR